MTSMTEAKNRLLLEITALPNAFVGVVDELLLVATENPVSLHWVGEDFLLSCRPGDSVIGEGFSFPFPRRLGPPTLARVAHLCSESDPDSFSPYGGEGEITVAGKKVAATWANTSGSKWLELFPAGVERPFRGSSRPQPAAV